MEVQSQNFHCIKLALRKDEVRRSEYPVIRGGHVKD